ncbi:hypothetical protein [Pelagerythrobacter aerophilus]|uniref:Uncharacterized protein n=1 Tax=Pelagerythrobacter aerophilus TaxID=2306995 RepID=A0A418NLG5_9SPHN|nr:hypothetical protein [Pelagerythrobacter aerophilus]RIV80356.1 hypothetical protein D2V04_03435 [Pelagerythrobacter aerophilus]
MTDATPLPLDEVLDMLLDEFETPSGEAIAAFSKQYPHYRADFLRFAAAWAEEEALLPSPPLSQESEERLDARAQSALQNALFARSQKNAGRTGEATKRNKSAGRADLAHLARSAGRSLHDVARETRIPLSFMSQLNAKHFIPDTIPGHIAGRLARSLKVGVDQIRAAWTGPPIMKRAMSYMAKDKPESGPQRDFVAAVRQSNLSDEDKDALLTEN